MGISDRIEGTIERWRTKWGDTLKGWLISFLSVGMEAFMNIIGKAASPIVKPLLDMIVARGKVPAELLPFLRELSEPSGEVAAMFAQSAGQSIIGGAIGKVLDAFLMPMGYDLMSWKRPMLLNAAQYLDLWLRGNITDAKLNQYLGWLGVDNAEQERLKVLTQIRLDPMSVITAWRRDPEKYEALFGDLREQGWSEDRIEALKFVTLIYPSRQDLIRYVAREALEPESIEKYGLMDEFGKLDLKLFEQIGVPLETARLDWIAHWEHASWMQVVEMLHRGLLTEEEVWDWFKLVEIPPFWRQPLIDSAYTWPTRVDVRRWWDMRTIDEPELRRLYSGMGYRGVNLDNYVLWTKVYVAFPDLMARWTKGWITEADVRAELVELGMPEDRVTEMIQTKVKPTEQEPISDAKKVTQTAIIKWVKVDIETRWEEGVDLLMDLGYDEKGARFVLDAYIADMGSPESYQDWKQVTARYREVRGMEFKPVTDELKAKAAELIKIKAEVEALRRAVFEEEKGLVEEENLPATATEALDEARVTLHRAEAELFRIQGEYDNLVARWKHEETESTAS